MLVPFGPKQLQGVIFDITPIPQVEETRDLGPALDPHPLLYHYQLELARWISQHYFSPLFEAAALMLPPGFRQKTLTYIVPLEASPQTLSLLSDGEREVYSWLCRRGKTEQKEPEKAFSRKRVQGVLPKLKALRLIKLSYPLAPPMARPKLVPWWLCLTVGEEEAQQVLEVLRKGRAKAQASLLELLIREKSIPLSSIKDLASTAVVKALREKGLVAVEKVRVEREPFFSKAFPPSPPPTLTQDQEMVLVPIIQTLEAGKAAVFLLHGVTGSGKTEIYLQALARTIALGKKGIVLVPEISLTPQTVERFSARFPGKVALIHSRLPLGEIYDQWWRLREEAYEVAIGSRSALFAPQPNLGLIVLDEEHDDSYKQEETPRYHAREVALKLAELTGAVVILGSATPDVLSYHRAQRGQYHLLELPRRVHSPASLPQVELVDMRKEWREGNRGIFSRPLKRSLAQALEAGEQAILFLNRRGTASWVQCRECGFVSRCPSCDTSLTYHQAEERLVCHLCHRRLPLPSVCPSCGRPELRFLGLGTQKVEQEVAQFLPVARLLRWDRDVSRGGKAYEENLTKFRDHKGDILIGTQMVAKGLDFPLVSLVGVINADIGLHLPDFRAGERTFQLLTQVAGRAGRGLPPGRVVIQTYSPEHYAIQAASRQDYASFYSQEVAYRRRLGVPPWGRLVRLIYQHTDSYRCQREAQRIGQLLKQKALSVPGLGVIGPAPAYFQRVRGHYRWQLFLRGADPSAALEGIRLPQGWAVDIDPVNVL